MSFILTIKGKDQTCVFGEKIIDGVTFNLDTAIDSRAKSTDFNVTMSITGN